MANLNDPNRAICFEGLLQYYKPQFFGGNWIECNAVLDSNSALTWYNKKVLYDNKKPLGSIILKNIIPYICIGETTNKLPIKKPKLQSFWSKKYLVAFAEDSKAKKCHWFYFSTQDYLNQWFNEILKTLPDASGKSEFDRYTYGPPKYSIISANNVESKNGKTAAKSTTTIAGSNKNKKPIISNNKTDDSLLFYNYGFGSCFYPYPGGIIGNNYPPTDSTGIDHCSNHHHTGHHHHDHDNGNSGGPTNHRHCHNGLNNTDSGFTSGSGGDMNTSHHATSTHHVSHHHDNTFSGGHGSSHVGGGHDHGITTATNFGGGSDFSSGGGGFSSGGDCGGGGFSGGGDCGSGGGGF